MNINDKYWLLIVRKLTDSLSEEEENDLQSWLSKSKDNEEIYRQAVKILELSESSLIKFESETDAEWLKLKAKIENNSSKEPISIEKRNFKWWYAAASIVLLIGVGFLMKTPSVDESENWITINTTQSIQEITLSDSSHIWLNANSSIQYPEHFSEDIRLIKLAGEGYFEIEPNKEKPFIIQVDNSEIRVVGTSFSIKSDEEEIEVFVSEGKVEFIGDIDDSDSKMELEAGKKGHFDKKTKISTVENHKSFPKWLDEIDDDLNHVIKKIDKGVNKLFKKLK